MYAPSVKHTRLTLASVVVVSAIACGGIVNFTPVDEDACDGLTCGDACGDGGTCTSDGTCSFGDVVCPPLCLLGACGGDCSVCTDVECVDGTCDESGVCVADADFIGCPN